MGATAGTSGFGTLFKRGNGASSELFSSVAEVKSISGPNLSMETIDATHMESPTGFREMLPSFKSGGEVTVELNFLPGASNHQNLLTDFSNRTLRNFQIVWPTTPAVTWGFSGYITAFAPNVAVDDILSASMTVTISGAPDFSVS